MGITALVSIFIGLPWLGVPLHHAVEDGSAAHRVGREIARTISMTQRVGSTTVYARLERIMTAENPDWRKQCLPETDRQRLLSDGK